MDWNGPVLPRTGRNSIELFCATELGIVKSTGEKTQEDLTCPGFLTVFRLCQRPKQLDPAGPIKRLRMGKERVSGSRADHTSLARQDYCTSTQVVSVPPLP